MVHWVILENLRNLVSGKYSLTVRLFLGHANLVLFKAEFRIYHYYDLLEEIKEIRNFYKKWDKPNYNLSFNYTESFSLHSVKTNQNLFPDE